MLLYNSLFKKPITTRTDDETGQKQQMLDLLAKSVYTCDDDNENINWNAVFGNSDAVVVRAEYVARPDLISLAKYGTDEYADLICKLNGISNPFELNEDMILLCPSRANLEMMICNTSTSCETISETDESTDNICAVDKENRKLLNEKRSPNEATIGDYNYIINKDLGVVFY